VALKQEFGACFGDADRAFVMDVYAAGEAPIPGVGGHTVVEAAQAQGATHVSHTPTGDEAVEAVLREARSGDLVITLGAGDVSKLGDKVLAGLRAAAAGAGGTR